MSAQPASRAVNGHCWVPGSDRCATCGTFMPGDTHMETYSGRYLDLADPDPSSITLHDVAHGLSLTCRYASQAPRFYSVAEHAYLVAQKLRAPGAPVLVQLAGLHHDDAEAFIVDQTRPMKVWLTQHTTALKEREASVFAAIVQAMGLGAVRFDAPAVKIADTWALAVESWHLLPSKGSTWFSAGFWHLTDTDGTPFVWTVGIGPAEAKQLWIEHLRDLCAGLPEIVV